MNGADTIATSNDNSGDGRLAPTLIAMFSQVSAFLPGDTASKDAALVTSVNGCRTAHAYSIAAAQGGVVLVEVCDTGVQLSPRLVNVSARDFAGRDS